MALRNSLLLAALIFLLAACAETTEVGTSVPTQTLIPVPPTATPVPPTFTPTPPPRLRPADILSPTPADLSTAMAGRVREVVAERESLAPGAVQIVDVQPRRWSDRETLDCDGPSPVLDRDRIPGFEVLLIAGRQVHVYHTDEDEMLRECLAAPIDEVPGDVLVRVDPIAMAFFQQAQARIAQRLDLPSQRVRLSEMQTITWPDSALGCPLPDQPYLQGPVDGYRMILTAATEDYIFHASFDEMIECDADDVVLP